MGVEIETITPGDGRTFPKRGQVCVVHYVVRCCPAELLQLCSGRMARRSDADLQMEAAEGGLKELVLRWFTETQAPLILNNGNFPDWFQGLATRKEAEDLLRDKALGCFLIRLSDKTIGYILSYKGHDRCRHFVISQDQNGQFVIAGDCRLFGSLREMIEHYRVSPIQPFGEVLTSTCSQDDTGDLYDVVNAKKDSGVSVQALRTMWDHKKEDQMGPGKNARIQQHQSDPVPVRAPVLPPKSRTRKLTGTVSVDAACLSQVLPPVPKRGIPLAFTLSGSLPETTLHPSETQTESSTAQGLRTHPASNKDSFRPSGSPDQTQVETRSQSLPYLGSNEEDEVEYSNQFSSLSFQPSPKSVTCQTYSLHRPEGLGSSRSGQQSSSLDQLRSNPLYEPSGGPGGSPAQQGDGTYAEVPQGLAPTRQTEDTYELIPGEATVVQSNTYESLEDMKTKKPKSTWGKSNKKWKKFLKK